MLPPPDYSDGSTLISTSAHNLPALECPAVLAGYDPADQHYRNYWLCSLAAALLILIHLPHSSLPHR